jgi:glycerophosphoryl diester phosphodiesterase
MLAALVAMRRRLPGIAARVLPEMGVSSMWVYHPIVSRRLAHVTHDAGIDLIAWTVDELPHMHRLVEAGVTGLCSNDPRLFASLDGQVLKGLAR